MSTASLCSGILKAKYPMKTNTPAASRAAIRVRRGKSQDVKQSNHQLGYDRFKNLLEKICVGMQEMASDVHASNPEERFAAVMFDRGNKQGLHLYGYGFRISIDMEELPERKGGLK